MEAFVTILGKSGLIGLTGIIVFIFGFRYGQELFSWIENQTMGTRSYLLEKFELLLIKVDPEKLTMPLLLFSLGLGALALIFFGIFSQWAMGLVFGGMLSFVGFKIPKYVVDYFVEKRIRKYQGQLVDGLTLLSNGLRAGLSVPQSLGMVVSELAAPLSQEFDLILQQNKVGVPLNECFDALAKRVPLEDNDMFVSSINILRESGGNLAEVFDTIVDVIRERIRIQQKVDTFTAQGRFQGYTIAAMPVLMMGVFFSSDPEGMMESMTHPIGIALILGAFILDGIGLMIILKIVKIRI